MNKTIYTKEEMQGKFIACNILFNPPSLGAVCYSRGINEGKPVLYNQIASAQEDSFFDDQIDHVIPASEYFERVASNNFKF